MAKNVKAGKGVEAEVTEDIKQRLELQKQLRKRASLKEVTNKLEIGPEKFKPSWTRPKLANRLVIRDNFAQQKSNFTGPKRMEGTRAPRDNTLGPQLGPSKSRPPDTLVSVKSGDALANIQNIRFGTERGVRAVNGSAAPEVYQMDEMMQEAE